MRAWLAASLFLLGPAAGSGLSCELSYPNPEIPIPPEIGRFIAAECRAARGSSEETEAECTRAESFGYQAQVMLLTDDLIGDYMAERYRECRAGLGTIGGRFHRHRADCMGGVVSRKWHFVFTREAALQHGHPVDFAALGLTVPDSAAVPRNSTGRRPSACAFAIPWVFGPERAVCIPESAPPA